MRGACKVQTKACVLYIGVFLVIQPNRTAVNTTWILCISTYHLSHSINVDLLLISFSLDRFELYEWMGRENEHIVFESNWIQFERHLPFFYWCMFCLPDVQRRLRHSVYFYKYNIYMRTDAQSGSQCIKIEIIQNENIIYRMGDNKFVCGMCGMCVIRHEAIRRHHCIERRKRKKIRLFFAIEPSMWKKENEGEWKKYCFAMVACLQRILVSSFQHTSASLHHFEWKW